MSPPLFKPGTRPAVARDAAKNARTVVDLASANLADARAALVAAETNLTSADPDIPKTVINARDACDLAAARVRKAERARDDATHAADVAERDASTAELAALVETVDAPRTWRALQGVAADLTAAQRRHAAEIDAIKSRGADILARHNEPRAAALVLASALGVEPLGAPSLPGAALGIAAALNAFDAGSMAPEKLLSIVCEVTGEIPVPDFQYRTGIHPDFPAGEQARSILDGTFPTRRGALRAEWDEFLAEDNRKARQRSAAEKIAAGWRSEGEAGAQSSARAVVGAGPIDQEDADRIVGHLKARRGVLAGLDSGE